MRYIPVKPGALPGEQPRYLLKKGTVTLVYAAAAGGGRPVLKGIVPLVYGHGPS